MKRKELLEKINGLSSKKQFLEAFLLQSAFVESLLKRLMEDDFFDHIFLHLPTPNNPERFTAFSVNAKSEILKRIEIIKKKLIKQRLVEIIEYLHEIKIIDSPLKNKLNDYRLKRNDILHNLVGRMSKNDFEKEIKIAVKEGKLILNNSIMVKASNTVQRNEDFENILKSSDPDKYKKYISLQWEDWLDYEKKFFNFYSKKDR